MVRVMLDGRRLAAATARFAPHYFAARVREPSAIAVVTELRRQSAEERRIEGGLGDVDEQGLVALASFEAKGGRATVYAAPTRIGSSFCYVHVIDDELTGGGCSNPASKALPSVVAGSSRLG
jgi:hypothetical protein